MIAGSLASEDVIASVRQQLNLHRPILEQYVLYLGRVVHGDLGKSWLTSRQVTEDILQRFPATLELITLALILAFFIALPLGMLTALRPETLADRLASGYGLLAGAMPDFWWALFLVFILFGQFQIVPAPGMSVELIPVPPPPRARRARYGRQHHCRRLGGVPVVAGSPGTSRLHPGLRLCRADFEDGEGDNVPRPAWQFCPVRKGMRTSEADRGPLCAAQRPSAGGHDLRASTYGYLIGGAVLIEQIFAWGGLGQYAVQAITSSDYMALSGVVLSTTVFSLLVYLAVDLIYLAIDPRIRY